jgi:hypothetical protein
MSYQFTFRQKQALKRLFELHVSMPAKSGFFASSIGGRNAAACRTPHMKASGMIEIDRMADNCFRYRLTPAGMAFAEFLSKPHGSTPPSSS